MSPKPIIEKSERTSVSPEETPDIETDAQKMKLGLKKAFF